MGLIKKDTLKKYFSGEEHFIIIPFSNIEERLNREFPNSGVSTENGYHTFVLTCTEYMNNKSWINNTIGHLDRLVVYKVNNKDFNKIKNIIQNTSYYAFDSIFGKENRIIITK